MNFKTGSTGVESAKTKKIEMQHVKDIILCTLVLIGVF